MKIGERWHDVMFQTVLIEGCMLGRVSVVNQGKEKKIWRQQRILASIKVAWLQASDMQFQESSKNPQRVSMQWSHSNPLLPLTSLRCLD